MGKIFYIIGSLYGRGASTKFEDITLLFPENLIITIVVFKWCKQTSLTKQRVQKWNDGEKRKFYCRMSTELSVIVPFGCQKFDVKYYATFKKNVIFLLLRTSSLKNFLVLCCNFFIMRRANVFFITKLVRLRTSDI